MSIFTTLPQGSYLATLCLQTIYRKKNKKKCLHKIRVPPYSKAVFECFGSAYIQSSCKGFS